MKLRYPSITTAVLIVSTAAWGQSGDPMKGMDMSKPMQMEHKTGAPSMTEGEVKGVDHASGKITLKHADIKNMGMPAMTMAFPVQDRAMLERVKQGDKVKFVVESLKNQPVITKIEAMK